MTSNTKRRHPFWQGRGDAIPATVIGLIAIASMPMCVCQDQQDVYIKVHSPILGRNLLATPLSLEGELEFFSSSPWASAGQGRLELVVDDDEGGGQTLWQGALDGRFISFSTSLRPLGTGHHELLLRLVVGGHDSESVMQERIIPFSVCHPSLAISYPPSGGTIPLAGARVDYMLELGSACEDAEDAFYPPPAIWLDGRLLGRAASFSFDLAPYISPLCKHNVTVVVSEGAERILSMATSIFTASTDTPRKTAASPRTSSTENAGTCPAMAPRSAVLLYHSNALQAYAPRWIKKCLDSIAKQTMQSFDVLELDYGNTSTSLVVDHKGLMAGREHVFLSVLLPNHARAANLLMSLAFERGYDFVFNAHVDDYYDPRRFELQIQELRKGLDLVSSLAQSVGEATEGEEDEELPETMGLERLLHLAADTPWSGVAIDRAVKRLLAQGANPLCNSAVGFSRGFFLAGGSVLEFDDPPDEDLRLWERTLVDMQLSVGVVAHVLVFYRRHRGQVSATMREESDEWHRSQGIR